MHSLRTNTLSNVAAKLWSTLSIYIFVPLYIKYLGEAAYGLVSFFATLQTAMNLLGLGLSNTLRREFAVGDPRDVENGTRKYQLLRSVELIYIALGLVIFVICAYGSGFIASEWLNIENLNPEQISTVISLMGLSIALQMIANLYAGCLFGLEFQVKANAYCVIWSALKSIGSLLIIMYIRPDLTLFYSWHILADFLYLMILRISIRRNLVYDYTTKWTFRAIKNLDGVWRYTLGVLTISLIALVNKQLDKIIISKFLTLTEFGAYNVATALGGLCTILPSALYVSVFPRLTGKISTNHRETNVKRDFQAFNKLTSIFISCFGAFVAIFSTQLIAVWTKSDVYTGLLTRVGPLVVLAITFIEYQEMPYALALAHGNTKINVIVGGAFIPLVCVATWQGIQNYGLLGAAAVYFIMMLSETILYQYWVTKRYISHHAIFLVLKDILLPFGLALVLAVLCHYLILAITTSLIGQISLAILAGGVSLMVLGLVLGRSEIVYLLSQSKDNLSEYEEE